MHKSIEAVFDGLQGNKEFARKVRRIMVGREVQELEKLLNEYRDQPESVELTIMLEEAKRSRSILLGSLN